MIFFSVQSVWVGWGRKKCRQFPMEPTQYFDCTLKKDFMNEMRVFVISLYRKYPEVRSLY